VNPAVRHPSQDLVMPPPCPMPLSPTCGSALSALGSHEEASGNIVIFRRKKTDKIKSLNGAVLNRKSW
jgi:hypothetical protein